MDYIVTLDQLLNVRNSITMNASEQAEHNELLEEFVYNQYDILDKKKKLQDLFYKFKSARYLYDFPVEEDIKISSNYELRESFNQRTTTSQVENAVERYIDKQLLTTDIYNSLMKVSYKLTSDEAIYLINTFMTHKSEEDIADLIGISKTYLQKIKKSCIVKMWVDLSKYCKVDD